MLQENSQDFAGSNQPSNFIPFNQMSARQRPGGLNAQSQQDNYDTMVQDSLMKSSPGHDNSHLGSGPLAQHHSVEQKGRGARGKSKKQKRVPLQMASTMIDSIIYPVKTKRGLKHAPKRKNDGFIPKDLM